MVGLASRLGTPYYHFIPKPMGILLRFGWPGQSVSVAWNAG